jgi:hypothetical protein
MNIVKAEKQDLKKILELQNKEEKLNERVKHVFLEKME